MKARYEFRYTVDRAFGASFPIDMLRYDQSYPATEGDAGKIERTFNLRERTTQSIDLVSDVATPTPARWASFGWTVVCVEKRRIA